MSATARVLAEQAWPAEDDEVRAAGQCAGGQGAGSQWEAGQSSTEPGRKKAARDGAQLALAGSSAGGRGARPRQQRDSAWNVLAKELVSFPRIPAPAEALERANRDPATSADGGRFSARAYAESWLDHERAVLRNLADAGYPSTGGSVVRSAEVASPLTRSRFLAGSLTGRAGGGPDLCGVRGTPSPRRDAHTRPAARPPRAAAVQPRGLRRLLPGVATLAALAGLWAGAGLLASTSQQPLAVLPGSVKTPEGYVYLVRPGDTLWSIASRVEPGRDPQALVALLENEIHGTPLQPGMHLVLP